jgi:hypothetical protein
MESFSLKMETVFVMISIVCFFLSIYFVVLSMYVIVDELLKVQPLALASSFFVGGVVIAILSAVLRIAGMRALR